ncbi:MAG: hypothetical protein HOE75_00750 [Chloroflexi bacterium]|nr:hypothetical protein [Chloroflexota bacterium]
MAVGSTGVGLDCGTGDGSTCSSSLDPGSETCVGVGGTSAFGFGEAETGGVVGVGLSGAGTGVGITEATAEGTGAVSARSEGLTSDAQARAKHTSADAIPTFIFIVPPRPEVELANDPLIVTSRRNK